MRIVFYYILRRLLQAYGSTAEICFSGNNESNDVMFFSGGMNNGYLYI